MQSIAQTSPTQIPDLTLIANNTANNQRQKQLITAIQNLSLELQQTLVLDKLLHIFCDQVVDLVPCDSVFYENKQIDFSWQKGKTELHSCIYQLTLGDIDLGQVTCTRKDPFSAEDLQVIEWLVAILIYPVRNALLYKQALDAALKDGLTGAANRSAYDEAMNREIDKSRRNGQGLSLLVIDIDLFKKFNDNYGHAVGDQVLQSVSHKVQEHLRTSDMLFRYGGEEFTVILSQTNGETASTVAERLREAISSMSITNKNEEISVTISIGAAELVATDDTHTLFERADLALYKAKETGRNCVKLAA